MRVSQFTGAGQSQLTRTDQNQGYADHHESDGDQLAAIDLFLESDTAEDQRHDVGDTAFSGLVDTGQSLSQGEQLQEQGADA